MAARYAEWLRYVFDRPATPRGWFFDLEVEPFAASNPEIAGFVADMCSRAESDLAKFTDQQVAAGLDYVFNNSCSDTVFALVDDEVPLARRIEAIHSIEALYSGCFAKRCVESLSHRNEASDHPLNGVCYMLWDVFPFSVWDDKPDRELHFSHAIELLSSCLAIGHVACTESALHGLGHMHAYAPRMVEASIDLWLQSHRSVRAPLSQYAQAARRGNIQ